MISLTWAVMAEEGRFVVHIRNTVGGELWAMHAGRHNKRFRIKSRASVNTAAR